MSDEMYKFFVKYYAYKVITGMCEINDVPEKYREKSTECITYYNQVKAGEITIDEVPEYYQAMVQYLIDFDL